MSSAVIFSVPQLARFDFIMFLIIIDGNSHVIHFPVFKTKGYVNHFQCWGNARDLLSDPLYEV